MVFLVSSPQGKRYYLHNRDLWIGILRWPTKGESAS